MFHIYLLFHLLSLCPSSIAFIVSSHFFFTLTVKVSPSRFFFFSPAFWFSHRFFFFFFFLYSLLVIHSLSLSSFTFLWLSWLLFCIPSSGQQGQCVGWKEERRWGVGSGPVIRSNKNTNQIHSSKSEPSSTRSSVDKKTPQKTARQAKTTSLSISRLY